MVEWGSKRILHLWAYVVAYVKRMDGLVDNVVACGMNDAVGFAYTSELPQEPPVGIRENNLDASAEVSAVEIYDLAGSLRIAKPGTDLRTVKLSQGVYSGAREKRKHVQREESIYPIRSP